MKKYVLYPGCVMPTEQYAYELSLRELCRFLDISLVDVMGFSCCGEPLKSINQLLTLSLSARNLALAEKQNFDILTPCPMCHLALSDSKRILDCDPVMRDRINTHLNEEGLIYQGQTSILHTIELLHDIIGVEDIKRRTKYPLKDIKIATHYGCHLIRPKEIGRPDDSENPQKIERIIEAIGGSPTYYAEKLDCCGGLLNANLPETALTKTGQKLQRVQEQGFDAFVDTCPWCHRQYDSRQKKAGETVAVKLNVPVFYLTQLVGLAFGIPRDKLGLDFNMSPIDKLVIGGTSL